MNDFISGGISGFCQTIVGHPLDTYKTLSQNNKFKFDKILNINPYAGIKYPLRSSVMNCSITFGINSYLYKNYNFDSCINGFISGAIISPIVFYFDSYKIRDQMNIKYKIDIWSRKGKFMSFLRESFAFSVYFKCYEILHDDFKCNSFLSGGISGLANWTVTYPIDTIKTRQATHNINIIKALEIGNLWKGYIPCAFRAIIVNSCGFYVYQECHNYFNN